MAIRKKDYGKVESLIEEIFKRDGQFEHQGALYTVLKVGKPHVQYGSGEPKTDVYVVAATLTGDQKEFKISAKKRKSNEFQENKINIERAEKIFGPGFAEIVTTAARNISHRFEALTLAHVSRKSTTPANSYTMGWKVELASKERRLSAELPLTNDQIKSYIYQGTNLLTPKRDAVVNGEIIIDSGIAEYIIYTELNELASMTATDVMNECTSIVEMDVGGHYIIFTANNFRTEKELDRTKSISTDGKRPLGVCVDWSLSNGKLKASINYDEPFLHTGYDQKFSLLEALDQLEKLHPSDLTADDFEDPSIFHE